MNPNAIVAYRMRADSAEAGFVFHEVIPGDPRPEGDWQPLAPWDPDLMGENDVVAWRKPSVFRADKFSTNKPPLDEIKQWEALCLWEPACQRQQGLKS